VIKEALEFLAKIQTPKNPIITSIESLNYTVKADGTLGDLIQRPVYPTLEVRSLGALVGFYKNNLKTARMKRHFMSSITRWSN
jgi:hypothetical protein